MPRYRSSVFWILISGLLHVTCGHLNLYLNDTETRRLLGIEGELYYVRDGQINRYAMTFNMPIKKGIHDLYFTWQNLVPPPEPPMAYSLSVTHNNPNAMHAPRFNIPLRGTVPPRVDFFRLTLPCTGQMTADVDVIIGINITMISAANMTELKFMRRKTCFEGEYPDILYKTGENLNASYTFTEDNSIKAFLSNNTNVFYLAVGSACAFILLIAVAVAVYYCCSNKAARNQRLRPYKRPIQGMYAPYVQKRPLPVPRPMPVVYAPYLQRSDTSSSQALSHSGHTYLRAETPSNSIIAGGPSLRRAVTPVSEMKPLEVRNRLSEVPIERDRITLAEILMEGTFGRIYSAIFKIEDENEVCSQQQVFVKTVTDAVRGDQIELMLRESCLMKGFCHQNVSPLLGACLEVEHQPLLVYAYASEGNLKRFLQRCKMAEMASAYALSTQQLVYLALQVSRGVQYLHRKRVVHRDIATRNCVIDSQLTVKVTDTALSRDLFPHDYHCLGDNENRPVKWLSLEALMERRFSTASDVWSFGVLMWELMTLGQQPYADVDPFEMATYLKEGYRIAQPSNCPDELFSVMACCWSLGPEERPKLAQLQACLQDFYTALGRFI